VKVASFDIFDTALIRRFGRPEGIDLLLKGKPHQRGDELERKIEEDNLLANPEIKALIKKKRMEGWQIVFISDMYLDSAFLEAVLRREYIFENGDKIYVSCEHNARKDSGTLYELVNAELQPAEWEHYGDNIKSDYKMAQAKGINAHLVDTGFSEIEKRYPPILDGISRAARLMFGMDPYSALAADIVAPTYIPYVKWVLDEAEKKGIDRLYFLSRDGYILMKIAEKIPHRVELRYLFVSRKSLKGAFEDSTVKKMVTDYFRQEGLLDKGIKSAAVDVGWYGTSRKMINEILTDSNASRIHFYYFGARNDVMPEKCGTFQSYLQKGCLPYYIQLVIEHYLSASPYPTTIGYYEREGKIEPLFPEGKHFQETKISSLNVETSVWMTESLADLGFVDTIQMKKWSASALKGLSDLSMNIDFSPMTGVGSFDGQDFVRKMTTGEILRMVLFGEHITVFDLGSISLSMGKKFSCLLWAVHCMSSQLRSLIYKIYFKG